MLWIGIGVGAALSVALVVLLLIVSQLSPKADHAEIAVANSGATSAAASAPPPQASDSVAPFSSGTVGGPTPVSGTSVPAAALSTSGGSVPPANAATQTPPAAAQPVSSVAPGTVSPPNAASSPTPPPVAAPSNPAQSYTVPSTPAPSSPAPSSPLPSTPVPSDPALVYRFNSGEEYAYAFSVTANAAGSSEQVSGMCSLTLSREAAPAEFASHAKTGQGSGSGFLVTSDGYLVTCAHVVEGTTKIDVVVNGGQSYPGQVVAFDKAHDLAVVRIIGSNLPTVPLGNSDVVELAQEVRAVGYPLSTVLGESVKITRGTVAGVVNTEGRKLFQVDASINPGNSGGPLVNEMGHVVGVASAKLAGEDIDGVGFAVPTNEVLNLLRTKGIAPAVATGGERLDGPSLARRVTPAVVMLKVTIGPGGYGLANRVLVDFSANVTSNQTRVVGNRRLSTPRIESERGKLLMSERGELIDATGSVQVPFMFGPVGMLVVEPLAAADERTWQTQRATALTQIIGEQSSNSLSMRSRRRRSPFASQTKVLITPAIETANYEVASTNGDLVSIRKRYVFQTLQPQGTPPIAQMTGDGTITFNRAKGFAEKMEFKATLVRSVNSLSVTVPLSLEWHRLDQATLEKTRAQAQANLESAKQAAAERAARDAAPPTPKRVDDVLKELRTAKDWPQRMGPLTALEKMQPINERRAQVTKAVEPLMRDGNAAVRDRAIHIMGRWGTKETVAILVKMLEQLDSGIRRATIEALGQIADASAARQLADLMSEQSDRNAAANALKKMGPIAEPMVIGLLKNKDKLVRHEACQILSAMGGPKSVAALKRVLQSEQDNLVRAAARSALTRLEK